MAAGRMEGGDFEQDVGRGVARSALLDSMQAPHRPGRQRIRIPHEQGVLGVAVEQIVELFGSGYLGFTVGGDSPRDREKGPGGVLAASDIDDGPNTTAAGGGANGKGRQR